MKNLRHLFLLLLAASLILTSCYNDDGALAPPAQQAELKLQKVTWPNAANGSETLVFEILYNSNGKISSGKGSDDRTFTFGYNNAGQIVTASSALPVGTHEDYTVNYDGAGRVTMITKLSYSHLGPLLSTHEFTFEYALNGKLIKMSSDMKGGIKTARAYTWQGDNISEMSFTNSNGDAHVEKYTYDTSMSPFYKMDLAAMLVFDGGRIGSKNNISSIEITKNAKVTMITRTYTYNSDNYPASQNGGGGSIAEKYYYIK